MVNTHTFLIINPLECGCSFDASLLIEFRHFLFKDQHSLKGRIISTKYEELRTFLFSFSNVFGDSIPHHYFNGWTANPAVALEDPINIRERMFTIYLVQFDEPQIISMLENLKLSPKKEKFQGRSGQFEYFTYSSS